MAKATRQKRVRRNRGEILCILEDLKKSGLSRKDFTRSRGLNPSSLDRWIHRSRKERWKKPRSSLLVPVEVQQPAQKDFTDGHPFEVVARNKRVVRVPALFDATALRRLLDVVEESC